MRIVAIDESFNYRGREKIYSILLYDEKRKFEIWLEQYGYIGEHIADCLIRAGRLHVKMRDRLEDRVITELMEQSSYKRDINELKSSFFVLKSDKKIKAIELNSIDIDAEFIELFMQNQTIKCKEMQNILKSFEERDSTFLNLNRG